MLSSQHKRNWYNASVKTSERSHDVKSGRPCVRKKPTQLIQLRYQVGCVSVVYTQLSSECHITWKIFALLLCTSNTSSTSSKIVRLFVFRAFNGSSDGVWWAWWLLRKWVSGRRGASPTYDEVPELKYPEPIAISVIVIIRSGRNVLKTMVM